MRYGVGTNGFTMDPLLGVWGPLWVWGPPCVRGSPWAWGPQRTMVHCLNFSVPILKVRVKGF